MILFVVSCLWGLCCTIWCRTFTFVKKRPLPAKQQCDFFLQKVLKMQIHRFVLQKCNSIIIVSLGTYPFFTQMIFHYSFMFQPFFLLHHILKMLFLYLHIFTIPRIELKSVISFVVSCLICTQTFFVRKWACVALYDVGHLHLLKRDHYRLSNSAKFFCKKC